MAGQLASGGPHPCLQFRHQRCDAILAHRQALFCGQPVDATFSIEDGIDPPHRFDRKRCFGNLRQFEEVASAMGPAASLNDRSRLAQRGVEVVEPGIGIGLKNAAVSGQMPPWVLSTAIR